MKRNLIKYGITTIATFLLAVSSCFSWGEEISPWKTITLYRLHAIHTGKYNEYDQFRYKNRSSIKYDAKDTALIYAVGNTVPLYWHSEPESYADIYPKLVYKQFLTKDSLVFDTIPVLKSNYGEFAGYQFWLSEDGTHYFYSTARTYVNIKEGKEYYLYMQVPFTAVDDVPRIIVKGNNYVIRSFSYCYPYNIFPTIFYGLIMWDSVGNQVSYLKLVGENKPAYYMDQSPDEKHIVAFHCAELYVGNSLEWESWMQYFGRNPYYASGIFGATTPIGLPDDTVVSVALIRIYNTDDISQHYTVYRFNYHTDWLGKNIPCEDTVMKAVQTNLPFRFSQDGSKLYIQNLFGQPIGPAEHQEYYCFVSDLENLTDKEENTPIDTIYLGYPLRQAHWFNNDKNVLIIDDSTNKITVLETENYTKVNEITLKSSNGRLLKDFQVFPEGDLVVGFNDPLDTNDRGTIQLFKLSSISGVEDDKEITSVLYPNPTTQSAVLHLTLPTANEIDIIVSDLAGKQLQTQFCGLLPEGISQIEINTSALSSGSYFVTAKGKDLSKTFKLIVKR